MAEGRISKRTVDALRCPAGKDRAFLWDDTLSGFGVAAFPAGKRIYVAQYRQAGRSRRISLGEHGRLTPEEARATAKRILGAVANGEDPIAKRKAERAVPTFREIADGYMARVRQFKKPKTLRSYEGLLRLHILPAIGGKRVTEIRRRDLVALHDSMHECPGAANRALAVFSATWTWAATKAHVDLGLPISPAKGIDRNAEESRERYLSTDELARLGDTLARAETVGLPYSVDETKAKAKHAPKPENRVRRVDPYAVAAIRLLLFTGARLREILHSRWDEIDIERGVLNLPASRSKTGKKPIILNAPALDILAALPHIEGNPHVICGEARDADGIGQPRYDLKAPWAAITEAAGLTGLRIHDLRHSFASVGAGASLGLPMIGRLLGHRSPLTTARYAHLDNDPARRAADTIGTTIAGALNRKPSADVTPIKRSG